MRGFASWDKFINYLPNYLGCSEHASQEKARLLLRCRDTSLVEPLDEICSVKSMKIAVMGASGLLGAAVSREVLARGYHLLPYASQSWADPKGKYEVSPLPLNDFDSVIRQLFDQWPDAIINCAAISSPDMVDQNRQLAQLINVESAKRLAEVSAHLGARHVHISTDMVFFINY